MKCIKLCCLLSALILLLCACTTGSDAPGKQTDPPLESLNRPETGSVSDPDASAVPAGTDAPVASTVPDTEPVSGTDTQAGTEPGADPVSPGPVSSAFEALFPDCPDAVTAVLYNAPFRYGEPEHAIRWTEGTYDQLYLIPRYAGSTVRAYSIHEETEDGPVLADEPAYSSEVGDGDVVYASLSRPEGASAWYVEVTTPDGAVSGMCLNYNGRTGTPTYEFLQAQSPDEDDFISVVRSARVAPLSTENIGQFAAAARQKGLDPWEAAQTFFTQLTDIGDGASFILSYGHEFDDGVYSFQFAKMHQNYTIEAYDIEALVMGQYSIYEQVGNQFGILGPEFQGQLPDLTYQPTGLTVFNQLLAAKEIRVTVDGQTVGTYTLPQDQFCTLIPLDLPARSADKPIRVEVQIVSAWFGAPEDAWIDVFGGLASNISGAI